MFEASASDSSNAETPSADVAPPVLEIVNAEVYYGDTQILFGVSVTVRRGQVR